MYKKSDKNTITRLSKTKKHPDFLKKKKGKLLIGAPNKFSTTTSCTRHEQHNIFYIA